jgi:hypothetical protein
MQRRLLFVKKYLLSLPIVLSLLVNGTPTFAQAIRQQLSYEWSGGVPNAASIPQGPRHLSSMLSTQAPRAKARLDYTHLGGASKQQQGSIIWPIGGGILGGAIGFFGGGFAGAYIEIGATPGSSEWEGLAGFIIGAAIGEAVLMPLGVHLGNGRRGNFGRALLTSVAMVGASCAAAAAYPPFIVVVALTPIWQLPTCVRIERSTGRSGSGKH